MKEKILKLKEAWGALAPREKRGITIAAPMLAVFILYQWIWTPFLNANNMLRQRIATDERHLVWMQAADKIIRHVENNHQADRQAITPVILLDLLQKQINQENMQSALTQLKQASNDSVEMHFQKVSFDKLMQLLITFSKENGISISQMSAVADKTAGLVNADVTISL